MTYIFATAYDSFSDYKLLKRIYNKLFENTNKDDLCFYCTRGSSGDNTCFRYIKENEIKVIDWLNPRKGKTIKEERQKILVNCDYAIIFINGYHKGMITALDQARKYVNKSVVIISTNLQEIGKFDKVLNKQTIYKYNENKIFKK